MQFPIFFLLSSPCEIAEPATLVNGKMNGLRPTLTSAPAYVADKRAIFPYLPVSHSISGRKGDILPKL